MAYFLFKTLTTAVIIAAISEVSKRFTFLASLLAAIPITSVLIFIWMYIEQKDVEKISVMSREVFFLVIPSLAFFLLLPFLLKKGISFAPAMGLSLFATSLIYFGYINIRELF